MSGGGLVAGGCRTGGARGAGVADVRLELTFDPPWTKALMSPAAKLFLGIEESSSPFVNIRL